MSDRTPLWLQSPDMLQLLHLLVNRLDGADQRRTRAQSIGLGPRNWPALYEASFESHKEQLWEQFATLVNWGWLAAKPDGVEKLRSGYDRAPRVTVLDEVSVRAAIGRPQRVRGAAERWRDAVFAGLIASEETQRLVGDYCIDIPERTMSDVVSRLNTLPSLAHTGLLLREVSSQLFWGMSKVLDKRQGMVAALLGVDECPFPESPVQLQVFLPASGFEGVLFIENAMNFEHAIRHRASAYEALALVYASGFRGSAQRLRTADGVSLFYSSQGSLAQGLRDGFEAWLFHKREQPVYFWGDLDWAGLRILAAMRASFPALSAWQPGYAPMLAALRAGEGHSPEAAEKQGQRALNVCGCTFADNQLIPALRDTGCFLDQELFRP